MLDGYPVARLQCAQPELTTWRVHAGSADAVGEVIATFVGMRPCGLLIFDGGIQGRPYAFFLRKGRLCSAVGRGQFETLTKWILERDRRDRVRGRDAPKGVSGSRWLTRAKEFVEESLQDALRCGHGASATVLLIQGDVHWLGDEINPQLAPDLQFLLLEHARRSDESPGVLARLGSLSQVAIPCQALPDHPQRAKCKGVGQDFVDQPDDAAMLEWRDAQDLFEWCDGVTTLEEAIEGAMVGYFRGVMALATLVKLGSITLVDTHEDSNVLSLDVQDRD